ncbi:DUF4111 domain-containing protein [Halobacillus litoralis]|uniref:DUF4111 domain-containing protein n=1 Tax=Halobacillus litoralis TaxID=45668 RepID=A0A845DYF7_9BACI|nr:aminoglycoside adenylyltransferase domain-containing protein [Halobacillus litoralis]MYL48314.1 DUF4111 domain-containing protein [Halobacillus litoralis]
MVDAFLVGCTEKFHEIFGENITGVYLHGSLVLGGFVPAKSDVDLIVVTEKPMSRMDAVQLTDFLLEQSGSPYPIEISVLNRDQLEEWQHPCPFDYHYSEAWRNRFLSGGSTFLDRGARKDADLAAHLTIIHHQGCVLFGKPVDEVFPPVPKQDYLDSILSDYEDCLENVEVEPVYSVLNILRVYYYLEDERIYSKDEAGQWALSSPFSKTVVKVLKRRRGDDVSISDEELSSFKRYYHEKIEASLQEKNVRVKGSVKVGD